MKKKLIFFGGTFDPPHAEHIEMLKRAKEEINPDKIIVMPTFRPPHKKTFYPASPKQRLELCREAFGDIQGVEISSMEIDKKGKSYSYITVEWLRRNYPEHDIFFLMGTDMLSSFHKWKNPERILKYATPLLCERDGEGEDSSVTVAKFYDRYKIKVQCILYEGKNLSSTKVKAYKLLGLDVSKYTSNAVNRLIDRFSLYQDSKYTTFLSENVKEKRRIHTANVVTLSVKYAKKLKANIEKTIIASMLHDCAKYLKVEDFPNFKIPNKVPSPVVHQFLGAYVAKEVLGVGDKVVLNAIKYHTSGKPKMSLIAKIIFVSDMLEESRDFEGVEFLRKACDEDFENGFKLCLKHSLNFANQKGDEVYSLTQKAINYYEKNLT